MPTIKVNKKLLMERIGKNISDKVLNEKLPYLGTTLEKNISGENEFELETYVNRPDFLSEQGLGRALKTFLDIGKGVYIPKITKSGCKAIIDKSVLKVRPYAVAALVKGLKFDEAQLLSIMQLQEKLHTTHGRNRKRVSIGIYDADKIQFPITYKTTDENFKFIPLDETREMTIKQILKEHPKGKEYAHLCPGPEYVIWVDAKNQILSFPPIINSAETAVTKRTKNVIIDVTGTESKNVEKALNIVCYHLADMGGKVHDIQIGKEVFPKLNPTHKIFEVNYCNKLLGMNFTQLQIEDLLMKMGHGIEPSTKRGNTITVNVPAYRTDVLHPLDLVEEVAIAYGYDNFEHKIPDISTIGEESRRRIFERKLAEVCTGFGMFECQTLHLSNEEDLVKKMNLDKARLLKTTNAINQNYNVVRNSILAMLIKTLGENTHYEYPQNLFEIGEVYDSPEEKVHLGLVLCNPDASYTQIRSYIEGILKCHGGDNYKIKAKDDPRFIPGRSAALIMNNTEVGIFGEIHPQILENFKIEMPTAGGEFYLKKMAK